MVRDCIYLVVGKFGQTYKLAKIFREDKLIEMLEFLIDNIYIIRVIHLGSK